MKIDKDLSTYSVALVYDKVTTQYGGAEWVLAALREAFPDAPLYTSMATENAVWSRLFSVKTSFLQRFPLHNPKLLVWLFPLAFESLDLSTFDVVISVTSGEAKGVLTKPNQLHISYMLTPPRYLHTHQETYLKSMPLLSLPFLSWITKKMLSYLAWWDKAASKRPDTVIAISKLIQNRIHTVYGLESSVLYPPVPDIPTTLPKLSLNQPYFLTLSRLVAYKKIDVAIAAALQENKTIIVAGGGEEAQRLQEKAGRFAKIRVQEPLETFLQRHANNGVQVLFTGKVSDLERLQLLQQAEALIMPGLEDFGITALEAAVLGTPTILHARSGVSEILEDTRHSIHIQKETIQEVRKALQRLSNTEISFNTLHTRAKKCSTSVFTRNIKKYVYDSIIQLNLQKKIVPKNRIERTACHISITPTQSSLQEAGEHDSGLNLERKHQSSS